MPYAAKAKIEHEFETDHLNVWVTFRHPMDQNLMPPLELWLLEADEVSISLVNSAWQDSWTLLLTSDTVVTSPDRVLLEYDGPNSNLQTTWGKDWEPWGPILSTDIGKAPGFVDRGDPAVDDVTLDNFITDGNWHDLNLVRIVPSNAKVVGFIMRIRADAINQYIYFKKKGNVNEKNISFVRTKGANLIEDEDCFCPIGPDSLLEYRTSVCEWDLMIFTTKGWWF